MPCSCDALRHISEDVLTAYAFGRLSRFRAERVENRLTVCPECQDRLQAEIDFIRAMQAAGEKLRRVRGNFRRNAYSP